MRVSVVFFFCPLPIPHRPLFISAYEIGDGEGWYDVGEGQCFLQEGDKGSFGTAEEYPE